MRPKRQINPKNIVSGDVNNVDGVTTCRGIPARIFHRQIMSLNLTKIWNPGRICGGESTKYSGNPCSVEENVNGMG